MKTRNRILRGVLTVAVGTMVLLGTTGCASLVLGGLAAGGAVVAKKPHSQRSKQGSEKTQLEIRQIQQREFETPDTKQVFMAVMSTLQDEGFIVRQAQVDVGLLNGAKNIDVAEAKNIFSATFFASVTGGKAVYANNAVIEVSANVSPHGEGTRVRTNFENRVYDNGGGVWATEVVGDEAYYQEFFSKVSKALFIEQEHL